jgi:SAM-dependent methyltransferase
VNVAEYARMFEVEERHWWYTGMRAISFALLDAAFPRQAGKPALILDAGCGTGNVLEHLGPRGRGFGVDVSEDAVRFSRQRGVRVARGSVLSLPFRDAAFDAVTSFDVLYHRWVEDDRAAVGELARVLKPGGLLLVRVPALECLRRAHDDAVMTRHRYTRRELRRLLEAAGLTVLGATYCNTLLLPLVVLRSTLDRLFGSQSSDLAPLPRPIEWTFGACLRAEARLVRHVSLPVGASVVALGRKPGAESRGARGEGGKGPSSRT